MHGSINVATTHAILTRHMSSLQASRENRVCGQSHQKNNRVGRKNIVSWESEPQVVIEMNVWVTMYTC